MKVLDRSGASKRCTSRQDRSCHGNRGLTAKALRSRTPSASGVMLMPFSRRGGMRLNSAKQPSSLWLVAKR